MDALAELQLKKKKAKEKEQVAKQAEIEQKRACSTDSLEEQRRLNLLFGFPEEPSGCFALGKEGLSAAVWWTYTSIVTSLDDIIGWEVLRYRKDFNHSPNQPPVWQYKGSHHFPVLEKFQVIIPDLGDGYDYRFSVKAINQKGKSLESSFSNTILIETALPSGWFRFYDLQHHKPYYASIKSNRSSWKRPDLDPFFIDDAIFSNFENREFKQLKDLYVEDITHFSMINVEQFLDICSEIGEKYSKSYIQKLFFTFANDSKITEWKHFLEIVNHLKLLHLNKQPVTSCTFCTVLLNRSKVKRILPPDRNKLGENWEVEFNPFVGKLYYKNIITGSCYWYMPDEIKFYLPKLLEEKLLSIFDYEELEEMKQSFSLLDIDNSGDLSENEIKLLLDSIGIKINENKLKKLMKAIDSNGNGTIEFDEFSWMMYEIKKKEKRKTTEFSSSNRSGTSSPLSPSKQNSSNNLSKILSDQYGSHTEVYNDSVFKGTFSFARLQESINKFGNKNKGKRRFSIFSSSDMFSVGGSSGGGDGKDDDSSSMVSYNAHGKNKGLLRFICGRKKFTQIFAGGDDSSAGGSLERDDNSLRSFDDKSYRKGSNPVVQFQREISFLTVDSPTVLSPTGSKIRSGSKILRSSSPSGNINEDDIGGFSKKKVRRKASFRDLSDEYSTNTGAKKKHSKHCFCGCRRY
jgi:Ca2+-binding EF-hand superfamily protein